MNAPTASALSALDVEDPLGATGFAVAFMAWLVAAHLAGRWADRASLPLRKMIGVGILLGILVATVPPLFSVLGACGLFHTVAVGFALIAPPAIVLMLAMSSNLLCRNAQSPATRLGRRFGMAAALFIGALAGTILGGGLASSVLGRPAYSLCSTLP